MSDGNKLPADGPEKRVRCARLSWVGRRLGHYTITARVGTGGVGEVYRAVDESLAREVAVKFLRPELAARSDVIERFRTEARTLAQLNHRNVATLYNLVEEGEVLGMVMEFVDGQTFTTLMREHGPLSLAMALPLFLQALDGIGYAHSQGVVHRDIKTSNLMLGANAEVKVMDFGIARCIGTDRLTRDGRMVGTAQYMSPEQVRGRDADARSDVYALGILLYEMLSGHVPFEADGEYDVLRAQVEQAPRPLSEHGVHVPRAIEAAIRHALAKHPADRFASTEALRAALESAGAEFETRAADPPTLVDASGSSPRTPPQTATAALTPPVLDDDDAPRRPYLSVAAALCMALLSQPTPASQVPGLPIARALASPVAAVSTAVPEDSAASTVLAVRPAPLAPVRRPGPKPSPLPDDDGDRSRAAAPPAAASKAPETLELRKRGWVIRRQ